MAIIQRIAKAKRMPDETPALATRKGNEREKIWVDYAQMIVDELPSMRGVKLPERPPLLPSDKEVWDAVKLYGQLGERADHETKEIMADLRGWNQATAKAELTLRGNLESLLSIMEQTAGASDPAVLEARLRVRSFLLNEHGVEVPDAFDDEGPTEIAARALAQRSKLPAHWRNMTKPPSVFDPEQP